MQNIFECYSPKMNGNSVLKALQDYLDVFKDKEMTTGRYSVMEKKIYLECMAFQWRKSGSVPSSTLVGFEMPFI